MEKARGFLIGVYFNSVVSLGKNFYKISLYELNDQGLDRQIRKKMLSIQNITQLTAFVQKIVKENKTVKHIYNFT